MVLWLLRGHPAHLCPGAPFIYTGQFVTSTRAAALARGCLETLTAVWLLRGHRAHVPPGAAFIYSGQFDSQADTFRHTQTPQPFLR